MLMDSWSLALFDGTGDSQGSSKSQSVFCVMLKDSWSLALLVAAGDGLRQLHVAVSQCSVWCWWTAEVWCCLMPLVMAEVAPRGRVREWWSVWCWRTVWIKSASLRCCWWWPVRTVCSRRQTWCSVWCCWTVWSQEHFDVESSRVSVPCDVAGWFKVRNTLLLALTKTALFGGVGAAWDAVGRFEVRNTLLLLLLTKTALHGRVSVPCDVVGWFEVRNTMLLALTKTALCGRVSAAWTLLDSLKSGTLCCCCCWPKQLYMVESALHGCCWTVWSQEHFVVAVADQDSSTW